MKIKEAFTNFNDWKQYCHVKKIINSQMSIKNFNFKPNNLNFAAYRNINIQ